MKPEGDDTSIDGVSSDELEYESSDWEDAISQMMELIGAVRG